MIVLCFWLIALRCFASVFYRLRNRRDLSQMRGAADGELQY